MKKTTLATMFIIIGLLLISNFNIISSSKIQVSYTGITLYAGGTGPGNYTKIQDAINDSSDGDTVFVYNGMYEENLTINKSITLIGEDKSNTMIYSYITCHIKLYADSIIFSNFNVYGDYGSIIEIDNDSCYVHDNIIGNLSTFGGIWLILVDHCKIENNIIGPSGNIFSVLGSNLEINNNTILNSCGSGIELYSGCNITISNNKIYDNYENGIFAFPLISVLKNITICKNQIGNNKIGCTIFTCDGVRISENIINNNAEIGIELIDSNNVTIDLNEIENNGFTIDASQEEYLYGGVNLIRSNSTVNKNNIQNNNHYGLKVNNCTAQAQNNYWGSMLGPNWIESDENEKPFLSWFCLKFLGDRVIENNGTINFFPWSINAN